MMRLDLTAVDVGTRLLIRDELLPFTATPGFIQAVAPACDAGVADILAPETADEAKDWKAVAAHLSQLLYRFPDPGAVLAAGAFHGFAADLDDHVRRLDEAAAHSEASLKYGMLSGEGEIVPDDEGKQS
jgi:hypothetical protein